MTEERTEQLLFDINGKLSSIETKLDGLNDTILKHEARLTSLENNFNKYIQNIKFKEPEDYKTALLMLLGKAILLAMVCLGTLAGAGGIISKIFN